MSRMKMSLSIPMGNGKIDKDIFRFCSFCQFANFTISFCQQNRQNGKIDKDIFHSAHSASLLTLPFHSASRMGKMGMSIKTFSFCSFCQFASFTSQQNGQNGKIDKNIFHSASLLTLPFHSASRILATA